MGGAAGYKVYVRQNGQSFGAGTNVGTPVMGGDGALHYVVSDLPTGVANLFAVSAYNGSGAESALSNELSLMVTASPTPTPSGIGSAGTPAATPTNTAVGVPPTATRTATRTAPPPTAIPTPTGSPAATVGGNGPVAAYAFSEGSGTTTADVSGYGRNGTLFGAPVWTTGKYGAALQFSGGTTWDGVNLAPNNSLDGLSQGTLEAWVKFDTSAAASVYDWFSGRDDSGCSYPFEFEINNRGGTVYWEIWAGDTAQCSATFQARVALANPAQWHHLAYVVGTSGNTWYVDGVAQTPTYFIGSASTKFFFASIAPSPDTRYDVGACDIQSGTFKGTVDDLRIYPRPLTQAEVQADMSASVGGTVPASTATATNTAVSTATATRTATSTATPPPSTPTRTLTSTATRTASATATNSPPPTRTATATRTSSPSSTATATSTRTPPSTATSSPSASATATPTRTATATRTATVTATRTATATNTAPSTSTQTATRTVPPSSTATATYTATSLPTNTITVTATRTAPSTVTSSASPSATATRTATATATNTVPPASTTTATHTAAPSTATATRTATQLPTTTITATATRTPPSTATNSASPSATATATRTATATNTSPPTKTALPTDTAAPVSTPTATYTATSPPTRTATATRTPPATTTRTAAPSATAIATQTTTATETDTPPPSSTETTPGTATPLPHTPTATSSAEPTATDAPEPTATATGTRTPTDTPLPPATVSFTPTPSVTPLPAWSVSIPTDVRAMPGTTVSVPVLIASGSGVRQFALHITFDPSVAAVQDVELSPDAGTGTLDADFSTPGDLTISAVLGQPMTAAGALVDVSFSAVGSCPSSTALTVVSCELDGGAVGCEPGEGSFLVGCGVAGSIRNWSNGSPVGRAVVTMRGRNGASTSTTNELGQFGFAATTTGTWQLEPQKSGDQQGAVSALDAAIVLQAAAGGRLLDPMQELACDVTGNGHVTALDAARILQLVVGRMARLPVAETCGSDWAFIPAPADLPNQSLIEPQLSIRSCQPGSIVFDPLLGEAPEQDFTAVLFGDCSGNWTSAVQGNARLQLAHDVRVRLGAARARGSGQWTVPLYVASSGPFRALDARVAYDPTARPTGLRAVGAAYDRIARYGTDGQGTLTLALASAEPLTADGGPVALLVFEGPSRRAGAPSIHLLHAAIDEVPVEIGN